uniref:Uncharacterized protein n=1 Tax=Parascaris equorum TaxID=6256 RepID=A0A914RZ96_PAREQ
ISGLEAELHSKNEALIAVQAQKDTSRDEDEVSYLMTSDLSNEVEQLKRDKDDLEKKLEAPIQQEFIQTAAAIPTEPCKQELLDRMQKDANNKEEEIKIGQLTAELNEKSRITDVLYHQIEELKKALEATGDSKKVFALCFRKVNGLENACKDKDAAIDALHREIEELRTITLETPHGALPAEGEHITKVSILKSSVTSLIRTWNFASFGAEILSMFLIVLA